MTPGAVNLKSFLFLSCGVLAGALCDTGLTAWLLWLNDCLCL